MSIAHADAQALCPLFSCILWKVGRFSLPVNNSKTLLYVFVSRYHTTCYHKDRQYFQILAAVTAIMSARGLCHTPGARFPFMGSLLPAQCRCTLAQCELRGFRFWIINTVAAGPVQYQPFISNQHYGNNITIKRTSPDKPQHWGKVREHFDRPQRYQSIRHGAHCGDMPGWASRRSWRLRLRNQRRRVCRRPHCGAWRFRTKQQNSEVCQSRRPCWRSNRGLAHSETGGGAFPPPILDIPSDFR